TVLYVAVAAVLTGMIPYKEIDIHAPIAEALRVAGFQWGSALVATGAVAGITSVLVVLMLGQVRVFFAMSRDRLLGPWLSCVHPRFGTPHHATLLTGIGIAVLAALVPIGEAADMTNIGTLFAFVLVCAGIIVLRRTRPSLPRPFKTPFMPWIPLLGMLCCIGLMAYLPWMTWIRFLVWSVIGVAVYFAYSVKHSRLNGETSTVPASGK
ncbi:MAG TPA: amino acid permease, partial [Candidatus Acidoferrum sp.]|nr:amino acid permease [Candidatus Acidoferrum sp.]